MRMRTALRFTRSMQGMSTALPLDAEPTGGLQAHGERDTYRSQSISCGCCRPAPESLSDMCKAASPCRWGQLSRRGLRDCHPCLSSSLCPRPTHQRTTASLRSAFFFLGAKADCLSCAKRERATVSLRSVASTSPSGTRSVAVTLAAPRWAHALCTLRRCHRGCASPQNPLQALATPGLPPARGLRAAAASTAARQLCLDAPCVGACRQQWRRQMRTTRSARSLLGRSTSFRTYSRRCGHRGLECAGACVCWRSQPRLHPDPPALVNERTRTQMRDARIHR
eukprot:365990-Chlamydomonas_euryale.AAC.17